jgi:anti-sigma B factor antagonist
MTAPSSRLIVEIGTGRSVRAEGVVDSHTAEQLLAELDGLGTDAGVDLDLSGVDFIDSSGLRVIVTVHQHLEAAGQRLRLLGTSDAVDRLLDITGLRPHLHVS